MLRSTGFCNVRTVWQLERRGMFHGYSPRHGSDAANLIQQYGEADVRATMDSVCGSSIAAADALTALKALTIEDFGNVKQTLAEQRSKQWHQVERWNTP